MTDTEKAALCARIDELCAEVERLREENHAIGMAAYEVGYKDASAHYELEHCPACKNIADLQEALEENAKLRKLGGFMLRCMKRNSDCADCLVNGEHCEISHIEADAIELGIEVDE